MSNYANIASLAAATAHAPPAPRTAQPAAQPHGETDEAIVIQQLHSLARELLVVEPSRSEGTTETANDSHAQYASDPTPVAVSLAYRLWLLIARAPRLTVAMSRIDVVFSRELVRHLVRLLDGNAHELSFLLVRLLATLARAPECGAILVDDTDDESGGSTFIALLTGLLRLGSAPLLTSELIRLIGELTGSSADAEDAYFEEGEAHALHVALQTASTPRKRASPAVAWSDQAKYHHRRYLQRAQSRALFLRAFLGTTGRNVLLLTRHLSASSLDEEVRAELLRILAVLATRSAVVRQHLARAADKWSAQALPPLPPQPASSDHGEIARRKEMHAARQAQLQTIRSLAAIVAHTATAPAPTQRAQR